MTQTIIIDGQPVEVPDWAKFVGFDTQGNLTCFDSKPSFLFGYYALRLFCVSDIKRHVILRTHDGVPVPPEWAKEFRVYFRDGQTHPRWDLTSAHRLTRYRWTLTGADNDIIAIEWLPASQ